VGRKKERNMTKEEAIKLADSRFWEGMTPRERATFQLFEDRLCMPLDVFHEALEEALGRPVFTHELGLNREGIQAELHGEAKRPTMQEIIDLIPADKRVIVVSVGKQDSQ
jgi:hypothetical protein